MKHRTNAERVAQYSAREAAHIKKAAAQRKIVTDSRWSENGFKLMNGARVPVSDPFHLVSEHHYDIDRIENDDVIRIPNACSDDDDDDGWSPTPNDATFTIHDEAWLGNDELNELD